MKHSKSSPKPTKNDASIEDAVAKLCVSALKEDYMESFPASEAWIRHAAARMGSDNNRLAHFLQSLQSQRYRIAYSAFILILLFAAANIPIKQEETLGHVISWSNTMTVSEAHDLKLQTPWMQPFQLAFLPDLSSSTTSFFLMMPRVLEDQALNYVRVLQGNQQISSASIHPLQEQVMRPAYALLLHLFRIDVQPNRSSNYEIINQLESQMSSMGMKDVGVYFERDQQGRPELHIWVATQMEKDSSAFTLGILSDSTSLPPNLPYDPKSFAGKSREEIKELIRAALKERFFENFNEAPQRSNPPDTLDQIK